MNQDTDPIKIEDALQPRSPAPQGPGSLLTPRQFIDLSRIGALVGRLQTELGITVRPDELRKISARIMKHGKNRSYRRRPQLIEPESGFRESYRDRRLRLIQESQQQGIEVARQRRHN